MLKLGKFVIVRKAKDAFEFFYKDSKNKTIFYSGSYTRKTMCISGIESVKLNSQDSSKFNKKTSSTGAFYFNLKSLNGKIIAVSELFEDRNLRNNIMDLIHTNAKDALIEDQSKMKKKKSNKGKDRSKLLIIG